MRRRVLLCNAKDPVKGGTILLLSGGQMHGIPEFLFRRRKNRQKAAHELDIRIGRCAGYRRQQLPPWQLREESGSSVPGAAGNGMKVALLHYWLINLRGGEKVLAELASLYPEADIFTHACDPSKIAAAFEGHRTSRTPATRQRSPPHSRGTGFMRHSSGNCHWRRSTVRSIFR